MTSSLQGLNLGVWRAFLRTHATVIQALGKEMQEEQNLPLTWFEVLVYLRDAPGGRLRMQDLADSVVLSRSGLTRLLDRMTEKGLVSREPCHDDRRGAYAVITPKGKDTLNSALPGHRRGIRRHFFQYLEEEDVDSLGEALSKVLKSEASNGGNGARP